MNSIDELRLQLSSECELNAKLLNDVLSGKQELDDCEKAKAAISLELEKMVLLTEKGRDLAEDKLFQVRETNDELRKVISSSTFCTFTFQSFHRISYRLSTHRSLNIKFSAICPFLLKENLALVTICTSRNSSILILRRTVKCPIIQR